MVEVLMPARLDTVIVIVDVPEPGAAIVEGLKVILTPDGAPDADNAMDELKPPETFVVIVTPPERPRFTVIEVGEALMVKSGLAPVGVTVKVTVVVSLRPPPVPSTVIGYVPVAVDEATAKDIVDVPDPGAAIEVGLKVTVTPVGWPEADKAIAEVNPPKTLVVIVDEPLLPCATETEPGEAEMVKLGDDVPAREVIRAEPLGLPHPVTKSYPTTAGKPLLPLVMSWK